MSTPIRRNPPDTFSAALMLGAGLSVVFLAVVAKAALWTGVFYVLFPELAALSYDVFTRPAGPWARAPLMLAITPAVTAALGTLITQAMAYNLWSVAITIAGAALIVALMRSPIVPAISAGFLPLVFGVTSWWYPVSIVAVMALLAIVSTLYGQTVGSRDLPQPPLRGIAARTDAPRTRRLKTKPPVLIFVAFLLAAYGLGAVTGLRLILFPPLVVIAFEMFAHPDIHPGAKRPLALPLVCTITAGTGLCALIAFGPGPLSVVISLLAGIAALRMLRLHFPPALAVGLLPQIMPHADWHFVLAVAVGTATLAGVFLLVRPLLVDPGVAPAKG